MVTTSLATAGYPNSIASLAKAPTAKAIGFSPVVQTAALNFGTANAAGISTARFSDIGISDATTTLAVTLNLKANQRYSFSIGYSGSQPTVTLQDSKGKSTTVKTGLGFTCTATGTYTLKFAAPFSLNLAGGLKNMVMTASPVLPGTSGNKNIDALLMGGTADWWHTASAPVVGTQAVAPGANGLDASSSATALTYSFLAAQPDGQTMNGFAAMDATQQQAVKDALAYYSKLLNVTFTEVTGGAGNINFGMNDQGSGSAGYSMLPGTSGTPDQTFLYLSNNASYGTTNNDAGVQPGNYGWLTILHELGHTLGLKHPGNYNGNSGTSPGPYLPAATDNRQYSIMSYHTDAATWGISNTTPMLYDVAALQYLYGANQSGSTAANGKFTFTDGNNYLENLWSASGTDTIDVSGLKNASNINLNAGTFSSINITGAANSKVYSGNNNVSVSYGSQINNVTLSSAAGVAEAVTLNNAFASGAFDRLSSFDAGADKIVLKKALFGSVSAKNIEFGSTATKSTSRIIVNTATGEIFYDADGMGKGVAKKIAQYSVIAGGAQLTGGNFSFVA